MAYQNAETLLKLDQSLVKNTFNEQIMVLTKKTDVTIKKLSIFEYLGVEDVTPKRINK